VTRSVVWIINGKDLLFGSRGRVNGVDVEYVILEAGLSEEMETMMFEEEVRCP